MTKHLRGRVALVTGGASGIGRACALALAGDGADLAIGSLLAKAGRTRPEVENSYYPTDEELSRTEAEIGEHGVRVFAAPLDVRDGIAVDTFIADASDALGPADIVVTAAGIDASQPVAEHDDGLWTQVIDTNLNGNFRVIKRCLPGMIERGRGRIVIIGSTSATIGAAGQAAYAAAKAGLLGLMRCVALEGAPHGVSCNMVSPATIETEMMRTAFLHKIERDEDVSWEEQWAKALKGYPGGRFLMPGEIGAVVAFLAREEAFGITMENVKVTAGALY